MSLLFNMLSRFIIAFLPRGNHSDFMAAVTILGDFRAQEEEICHSFTFSPYICREVMGPDAIILVFFLIFSFKPALSLSCFNLMKMLFSSSSFSAIRVVSSTYLRLLLFLFIMLSQHVYWSGLPSPPPVELSTMTWPSWVALHGMAHSFTELHKPLCHRTVLHEGAVSFTPMAKCFPSACPSIWFLQAFMLHLPGLQQSNGPVKAFWT